MLARQLRKLLLATIPGVLILVFGLMAWLAELPHALWVSSDGRRMVVVHKQWVWTLLPGPFWQGDGVPGWVSVVDTDSGKVIFRRRLDAVSQADAVLARNGFR